MKTTHSPLPWKLEKNAPECVPAFNIWDAEGVMVGYLGHCRQPGQAEANGQMIVAAPKLLAALERLEKEVSGTVGPGFVDCGDDPLLIAVFEARVAIEAAKGGAA